MSNYTVSIPLKGKHGNGKFMLIDSADLPMFQDLPEPYLSKQYAAVAMYGKRYMVHRLILQADKSCFVDHINGNPLDNRRENLRLCTIGENNRNKPKHKGTGDFKGVGWDARRQTWLAYIARDGQLTSLGSFESPEFAADVYDAAAHQYHGEFASLNNPDRITDEAKAYLAEYFGPRWRIVSPQGEVILLDSLAETCRAFGLTRTAMVYVAQGRSKQHKGWTCQRISTLPVRRSLKPADLA